MGFYKFYKIIKDFLHKPFKTALIFIVIAIIISIFSNSVFAATSDNYYQNDESYKTDPLDIVLNYQKNGLSTLMNCMLQVKTNGQWNHKDSLNKLLDMYDDYFYYYETARSENYPIIGFLYLYTYEDYNSGYDINTHFTYLNDYVNVPISSRNLQAYRLDVSATTLFMHDDKKYNISIPFNVVNTRNSNFDEFCRNFNNKSTNDLYVMLQNINENIKKTNDFLNDKNVDNSSMSIPSDTSSDSTEDGFNQIFDKVYTAFTDSNLGNGSSLKFTIPYINYPVEIPSGINSLYLKIKHPEFRPLISLFEMLWWFGISYYIVKDVNKYIDDIKNGNINTTDTNIKTEML